MNQIVTELRPISRTTSAATIRSHHLLIDRPEEKGGTDLGPMGGELFLASIGGCFMSNLLAAMRAREVSVSDITTTVIGTLESAPARFSAVELRVEAAGPIDELERLVEIADRGCITMNTLRAGLGLRIHTRTRTAADAAEPVSPPD